MIQIKLLKFPLKIVIKKIKNILKGNNDNKNLEKYFKE